MGDALDVALQRKGAVLYHPDAVRDFVPAEVVAHAVGHAVAAAAAGGGGSMLTLDVSLDEPVSQLTFYRMVQAAADKARCARPAAAAAAAFKIDFGRGALGCVGGVLYTIGAALGAKVTAAAATTTRLPPSCSHPPRTRCCLT